MDIASLVGLIGCGRGHFGGDDRRRWRRALY
ncbi:MAG: hypothetical protein CM15mP85_04780 [Rhodobacterales bacterium]|nr:MAG: hypothetical protein CM15mP85_04780 [Rhodobacterales bacterium]